MRTLMIIYLTILHTYVIASVFLYVNDTYTLAKLEKPEVYALADDYNMMLDKHTKKTKH